MKKDTNCVVCFEGKWSNETFEVEFTAMGKYWYQPCVMYFKDGTGQPEDWDVEDIEVVIKSIKNKETGITVTELSSDDAFNRAGIGRGALASLDYYEEIEED